MSGIQIPNMLFILKIQQRRLHENLLIFDEVMNKNKLGSFYLRTLYIIVSAERQRAKRLQIRNIFLTLGAFVATTEPIRCNGTRKRTKCTGCGQKVSPEDFLAFSRQWLFCRTPYISLCNNSPRSLCIVVLKEGKSWNRTVFSTETFYGGARRFVVAPIISVVLLS